MLRHYAAGVTATTGTSGTQSKQPSWAQRPPVVCRGLFCSTSSLRVVFWPQRQPCYTRNIGRGICAYDYLAPFMQMPGVGAFCGREMAQRSQIAYGYYYWPFAFSFDNRRGYGIKTNDLCTTTYRIRQVMFSSGMFLTKNKGAKVKMPTNENQDDQGVS